MSKKCVKCKENGALRHATTQHESTLDVKKSWSDFFGKVFKLCRGNQIQTKLQHYKQQVPRTASRGVMILTCSLLGQMLTYRRLQTSHSISKKPNLKTGQKAFNQVNTIKLLDRCHADIHWMAAL